MRQRRIAVLCRRAALPLAALALIAAGTLIGVRLVGAADEQTALGRVSFKIAPSLPGGVETYVPVADWGLRSAAFAGPFELRLELRTLERDALLAAASGDPGVLDRTRAELGDGAVAAVLRTIAGVVASTALLTALVTAAWPRARRDRWRLPAMTAGGLGVVVAGVIVLAWTTFDEGALENPTYYARGAELERLLAAAEADRVTSAYGSELESIVRSVSTVLADRPIRERTGRTLYLASDLHANALVIDPLARFFDGAPVLFAGDFGQRGNAAEAALLARRVAALGDPVIAVSGNHDSDLLMDQLAGAGVEVLGRPVGEPAVTVDGVRVAGYADPLEGRAPGIDDPDRPLTFDDLPDGDERAEREAVALRDWFDRLEPAPDVVVVHQDALGQSLAESLLEDGYSRPLTIATGHDHRQHVDRYGEVVVVDAGTIGAGGIFDAGVAFSGFAELHFDAERPTIRAVDMVAVEPFSGRGRGSRVVIDTLCPDEDRCTFTPAEPEVEIPVP